MDAKPPMHGPILKIERAEYHILEIEKIFTAYIAENAKAMRLQDDSDGLEKPATMVTGLPRHLPAVIGDAVHNLRVALDHAYWITVQANGAVEFTTRIKFPFFDNKKQCKRTLGGYAAVLKPSADVLRFIFDDLEPFLGRKLGLYELHRLDFTDKHEIILPTRASHPDGYRICRHDWA